MKKCTYCGKEYPDDATACERDMQPLVGTDPQMSGSSETQPPATNPTSPAGKSFGSELLGGIVIMLVIFGFLAFRDWNGPTGKANYDKIQAGMSLVAVEQILGKRLDNVSDSERASYTGEAKWYSVDYLQVAGPGNGWKEINVVFRDGLVVSKSHAER